MLWSRKLLIWIKKNWKWIAGSFAVFLSVLGLYSIRKNLKEYLIQKQKVSLNKKKRDIEVLKVKKQLIEAGIKNTEDKIEKVDERIQGIDESIANLHEEIAKLSSGEKLDKFDELGY